MNSLKENVLISIENAQQRKSALVKKTPNDISSIRYWDGYISALTSIVNLLPDEYIVYLEKDSVWEQ